MSEISCLVPDRLVRPRTCSCTEPTLERWEGRVQYFPRTDKTSPNGANVISDILSRLGGSNNDGEVLSRQIQSCSFVLYKYVYDMADNMVMQGGVVIDVGSGHLQSRVFYENSPNSFLLCDPLLDSSTLPRRSRVTDVTDIGSVSIVSVLKAMSRGRVKYIIYRDTIKSLMRHPEVYEYVRRTRIPLVYSFSLSRVHHVFNALCRDELTVCRWEEVWVGGKRGEDMEYEQLGE